MYIDIVCIKINIHYFPNYTRIYSTHIFVTETGHVEEPKSRILKRYIRLRCAIESVK
jgi:hypothetical protein